MSGELHDCIRKLHLMPARGFSQDKLDIGTILVALKDEGKKPKFYILGRLDALATQDAEPWAKQLLEDVSSSRSWFADEMKKETDDSRYKMGQTLTWNAKKPDDKGHQDTSNITHLLTYVGKSFMTQKSMSAALSILVKIITLGFGFSKSYKDNIQNYRRHVLEPNYFFKELKAHWKLDGSAAGLVARARELGKAGAPPPPPTELMYAVVTETAFVSDMSASSATSCEMKGEAALPGESYGGGGRGDRERAYVAASSSLFFGFMAMAFSVKAAGGSGLAVADLQLPKKMLQSKLYKVAAAAKAPWGEEHQEHAEGHRARCSFEVMMVDAGGSMEVTAQEVTAPHAGQERGRSSKIDTTTPAKKTKGQKTGPAAGRKSATVSKPAGISKKVAAKGAQKAVRKNKL